MKKNKRPIQQRIERLEAEADREIEAAGLMSKRKLAAILHSNPALQRAILGAVARQKGGTHDNAGTTEQAQGTAARTENGQA